MNKEELNKEIEKLKAIILTHEEQVKILQGNLEVAQKKLIDADKPKLTVKQLQAIENAIDKTIRNYSFDDVDNYDCEMSMEYDNKVYVSHINFEAEDDLADEIYKNVEDLFGIADESDDTQDVTNE